MNFNPIDLIRIKEALYPRDSKEFEAITHFIDKLVDLQADQYHHLPVGIRDLLGSDFFKRQDMIETAFKLVKMEFDFLKDKFLFGVGQKP